MALSLGLILVCQLVGEVITRGAGLPVPGPVIGLVLCVLLLAARDRIGRWAPGWGPPGRAPADRAEAALEQTGRGLLSHLSMLFVPAGVGVIQRLDVLAGNALAIAVSVVLSTVLCLAVTALVFNFVARRTG